MAEKSSTNLESMMYKFLFVSLFAVCAMGAVTSCSSDEKEGMTMDEMREAAHDAADDMEEEGRRIESEWNK